MLLDFINSHEVLQFFRRKAAHRSSKRYVCFTKKWLNDEFVVMIDSDSFEEVNEFFLAQSLKCQEESPRLIFDQLLGIVVACHNEDLVLSTMDVLSDKVNKRRYLFRDSSNTWSVENYLARQSEDVSLLDQINRYSGWFTEKARRTSYHRFVCFTKCTLPLDFIIFIPEYGDTVDSLHRILDEHPHRETSPKMIFDQEEQLVLRTSNDEVVLNTLLKIIENEVAELEETGALSDGWRTNPVRYYRKNDISKRKSIAVTSK